MHVAHVIRLGWPLAVSAMAFGLLGCGAAPPTAGDTVPPASPIVAIPTGPPGPSPSPTASSFDNYDALIARGEQLVGEEQLDEAERIFDEARRLRPSDVRADYGKAVVAGRHCHLEKQRCNECIERLNALLAEGAYRHSLYNRGSCHFTMGHAKQALQDLNAAISQNVEDADYRLTRGLVLFELGRSADACVDFEASERLGGPPTPPPFVDACGKHSAGGQTPP